jgi:hypothetical protein
MILGVLNLVLDHISIVGFRIKGISKKTWILFSSFTANIGIVILKQFYVYCRIKQMLILFENWIFSLREGKYIRWNQNIKIKVVILYILIMNLWILKTLFFWFGSLKRLRSNDTQVALSMPGTHIFVSKYKSAIKGTRTPVGITDSSERCQLITETCFDPQSKEAFEN